MSDLNEEKQRILRIQEQGRKQLARNLHDGLSQTVAAIAMRASLARRQLAAHPATAEEELVELEALARQASKEFRHLLFTLHPQTLEESGLVAALKDLAAHFEEAYEQKIQIEAGADVTAHMDFRSQGVLFYIAAEAISNARRHAQARNIHLRLSKPEGDVVLLEVEDDGQGFTAQEEQAKRDHEGALGLDTLRERVELINGVLRLDSQPGRGTQLRVWAPLNEQAAERLRQGK